MKRWLIGLMATAMMIGVPVVTQAIPGAKVLLTSRGMGSGKVIEVDPITKSIVWEYAGTGTYFGPNESIPLTNGNIIVADESNNRLIEVNPAKQIVWQWQEPGNIYFWPLDVKRTPQGTLLAVDGDKKVIEIEYPAGDVIWTSGTISTVHEAERLPGTGTPTYLITQVYVPGTSTGRVMMMQRDGTVLWEKTGLRFPFDATQLVDDSILICELETSPYQRVTKVDYDTKAITWEYGSSTLFNLAEAIPIENGHYLIAGSKVIEVDPLDNSVVWEYSGGMYGFDDVEEKGIINIAKVEYSDSSEQPRKMKPTFAGVIVPIFQPEIIQVGTPTIVATKTVVNSDGMPLQGPQKPGQVLTYKIELTNTGEGTATSVVVTDRVPDGTKYVVDSDTPPADQFSNNGGASWDASEDELITHLRWNLGNLAPGETKILKFSVVIQ